MRQVILNKKPWALGLNWIPKTGKTDRATLRATAKILNDRHSVNFDLAAVRARQVGFAVSEGNVQWLQCRSLAAALHVPGDSFVGIFPLRDTAGELFWWVFAMQHGLILGLGDLDSQTLEEAQKEVKNLTDLLSGNFSHEKICATPEESVEWLEPLLKSGFFASQKHFLMPLTYKQSSNKLLIGAGITALSLATIFAGFEAYSYYMNLQAQQSAALFASSRKQRMAEIQSQPEKFFEMPWEKASHVVDVFTGCREALFTLPLSVAAWELGSVQCSGKSAVVKWEHRPGASFLSLPFEGVLDSPNQVLSRQKVDLGSACERDPLPFTALFTRQQVSQDFYQLTQDMGAKLKLAFSPQESKKVEEVQVVAPWQNGTFELSEVPDALILDGSIALALARLPGAVLRSVVFEKNWSLKGDIYVLPK